MSIVWEGVMPAITTKFTADDQIDFNLGKINLQAQLDAGVHGIILGGTLGEASTLTLKEKEELTVQTVDFVAGAVPVVMNIAEASTRDAIAAVKAAEKNGASALMALPPMRYKANSYEVMEWFNTIAANTGLDIMIYNNPVDYGIEVTLDMFEILVSKNENIKAVKDSARDISNVTRIRNRFGERLKVLCGVDTLAMESLLMGADGWVAGLVCAFPAETVAVYELTKAGRLTEALEIYRWFLPLLELDINPQLVQNIKMAEVATGIGSEYVRGPRLPLQGKERERVTQIISSSLETRPTLPEYKGLRAVGV
ncbi:MAG: dihydrodipicolinate synthase family protein [Saprospiraceae bacterium]|nr:dihydrodipicolinate synthase family protein [Saprospiraceae bacterium]